MVVRLIPQVPKYKVSQVRNNASRGSGVLARSSPRVPECKVSRVQNNASRGSGILARSSPECLSIRIIWGDSCFYCCSVCLHKWLSNRIGSRKGVDEKGSGQSMDRRGGGSPHSMDYQHLRQSLGSLAYRLHHL